MSKQESIQYLTGLMDVIWNAYFKSGLFDPLEYDDNSKMTGDLRVHEGSRGGISIDLYHFEGDGKPVCDGLAFCAADADARQDPIMPFCICYNPDDGQRSLVLLCTFEDDTADFELTPENIPAKVLCNIAAWIERAMQPMAQ